MPPNQDLLGIEFFEIEFNNFFNMFSFNITVPKCDTRSSNIMLARGTRSNIWCQNVIYRVET